MTIQVTTPAKGVRVYPHVNEIAEYPAQQSVRLLWDRIHALTEIVLALQTTITDVVAGTNTNAAAIVTAQRAADQALALAQRPGAASSSDPGGGGTDDTPPDGGDGGGGSEGCAAAGATGHDSGGLLNAVRAGQIACGTGNEYPALKNAVATLAAREANQEELIRRMIWHLKQAGFTAGRQKNPSGAISKDKLAVVVDGVTRAYDMLPGVDPSVPLTTHMDEVFPANLVDDAGIPD